LENSVEKEEIEIKNMHFKVPISIFVNGQPMFDLTLDKVSPTNFLRV